MKCYKCENGEMQKVEGRDQFTLVGAPTFTITGFDWLKCNNPNCLNQVVTAEESDRLTMNRLKEVFDHYKTREHEVPDKVGHWILSALELPVNKFTELVGHLDSSTLSYGHNRHTTMNRDAAIVLLSLVSVKISEP